MPVRGFFWNAWAGHPEEPFSPVRALQPDTSYRVALDLSALDYSLSSGASSQPVGRLMDEKLQEWIQKLPAGSRPALTVLFLPDPSYFDNVPTAERVRRFPIDLQKIDRFRPTDYPLAKASDPNFRFGRAFVDLRTKRKRGPTSVGISIWEGVRPIDEIVLPLCVGSEPDCAGRRPLTMSLRGSDSVRVAVEGEAASALPDAALHFVDLNVGSAIGIFHRNGEFVTWRVGESPAELSKYLQERLVAALKDATNPEGLTAVGAGLYDKLFPFDEEGQAARQAFEQFFRQSRASSRPGRAASVFVRMFGQEGETYSIVPIGLMAVPVESGRELLGLEFRVETPLPVQDYRPVPSCISDWVVVVPPENGEGRQELKNARTRIAPQIAAWQTQAKLFQNIGAFRSWADRSETEPRSTALMTLSHHDRERLFFSPSDAIGESAVHRQFPAPSVAILSGCGTGGPGAAAFVRTLNKRGVSAVIATSMEIDPLLAGDFLAVLEKTVAQRGNRGIPISEALSLTLGQLKSAQPSPDGPSLRPLCAGVLVAGQRQCLALSARPETGETMRNRSCWSLLWWLAIMPAWAAAPPGSTRLTIFISDTHFGVGRDDAGRWRNYEDARWAPEFKLFLDHVNQLGQGKADLVINGDMLELWQSVIPNDCIDPADKNLGCSEDQALQRLQRVLKFHAGEMQALGKFASAGSNRLVIVPGNHDVALLFDGLAQALLRAIGARPDRVHLETKGYWLSADGLVYAEHGHQIGKEVNRFKNWPKPFLPARQTLYLERPWGEQFVQRYYNQFEDKYPIIDNFSEDLGGIKYGVAAEGLRTFDDIDKLLDFYVRQVSMRQFGASLGGSQGAPVWDIAAIRKMGPRFLLESLETGDELRQAAEQRAKDGALEVSLEGLSDEEITGICNYRQKLLASQLKSETAPTITACPQKSLGAAAQKLFSNRDKVFGQHLDETRQRLSASGATDHGFDLFVYSHTHLSDSGFYVINDPPRRWNPLIVNTGAWQRTVTPEQLNRIQAQKKLDKRGVLTLRPEDLPACYPFVLVEPYSKTPAPQLRFWRQNGARWEAGEVCR